MTEYSQPIGSIELQGKKGTVKVAIHHGGALSIHAVELHGITKRFPGVIANHDVELIVRPGTIHAIVGENGAGKSTLMKTLYGMH